MRKKNLSRVTGAVFLSAGLLLASPALAALAAWEIDQTQSQLTLVVPDQDVTIDTLTVNIRLRNQGGQDAGPWNIGNVASVDGQIVTDYVDGVSIEFLAGQHNVFALVSGSYRPNPASFNPLLTNPENPDGQFADASTAPGAYGARVRAALGLVFDAAFVNFTDVLYDFASGVLPITVGSFASDALDIGLDQTVAFDGLSTLVGQPIPDAQAFPLFAAGTNLAPGATIVATGPQQRRLTLPVNLPLEIDLNGVLLDAIATGTIVANLPEPGAIPLLGAGIVLLAWLDARRRRCAPH